MRHAVRGNWVVGCETEDGGESAGVIDKQLAVQA